MFNLLNGFSKFNIVGNPEEESLIENTPPDVLDNTGKIIIIAGATFIIAALIYLAWRSNCFTSISIPAFCDDIHHRLRVYQLTNTDESMSIEDNEEAEDHQQIFPSASPRAFDYVIA